jgi:acyl-coenzyme A thioesterase PaaI-like protein
METALQLSQVLQAVSQSDCVVCGSNHPHGLRIRYELHQDGTVSAKWAPTTDWEGFRGIVHGGIISTVLDEAMSKAVAATQGEALTAELRVRYRHHVEPGEDLYIRGWVVERRKRLIRTEATLATADGHERARAWGTFLALPHPES